MRLPLFLSKSMTRVPEKRIRTREPDRSEKDCRDLYVVISQWYRSGRYPVVRIRRGYVYFRTEE